MQISCQGENAKCVIRDKKSLRWKICGFSFGKLSRKISVSFMRYTKFHLALCYSTIFWSRVLADFTFKNFPSTIRTEFSLSDPWRHFEGWYAQLLCELRIDFLPSIEKSIY